MTCEHTALQLLLVEDNTADAELTMDALRAGGLVNTVKWVRDGAEALELLLGNAQEGTPRLDLKLVLLDLRLPRVDGLEVLKRIRADVRTRLLPVVVLTSSQEESDLVRAYDLGANSYLVKPVESEMFMKAVAELGLYWMLLNQLPGTTA
ncbi:MAG: response regulator [Synechococcaceae cyanobacterium ELA739]